MVQQIREAHPRTPKFSRRDAGERARVLFVLETPNDVAVENGYCEVENGDPTAERMLKAWENAELHRRMTASWNVVPWERKDARADDIKEALPWLGKVVKLMPALAAVVLCGDKSRLATPMLYEELPVDVAVLHAPHPSNRGCQTEERRRWFFDAVRRAKVLAYAGASGSYAAEVAEDPSIDDGWK